MSPREYLFSLEQLGVKLGLEQIRLLVATLGHPERTFRSLLVAGTNGKGSVTAMLERGLRAAGHRTGRYTSPHLVDLEERFAIGGRPIAPAETDRLAARIRGAAAALPAPPSFFEATTALAFEAFRDAGVEIAVLEVGLGGRLDATNVVDQIGAAITAVDFDHEAFLGDTIEAIAGEKAAVIKPGSLVVLGDNPPAVLEVVAAASRAAPAALVRAMDGVAVQAALDRVSGRTRVQLATPRAAYGDVVLALRGRHQIANAITAVRLLEELDARQIVPVPRAAIRTALEDVDWPARLELRRWRGVDVLIDGAHNPAGARALASYVSEVYERRLPVVAGAMRDKKIQALIAALAPAASHFVFTAAPTARAASADELATAAAAAAPGVASEAVDDPLAAIERAATLGAPVVVAGSLYLAGEIRARLS
jgi:dihydrofolate synthase/folylpolyglutamate synthase